MRNMEPFRAEPGVKGSFLEEESRDEAMSGEAPSEARMMQEPRWHLDVV